MPQSNRQWRLRRRPAGDLAPGDLKLVTSLVPAQGPNQGLARNLYLVFDAIAGAIGGKLVVQIGSQP